MFTVNGPRLEKQGQEASLRLSNLPDAEHQQITWVPTTDLSGVQALRTPLSATKDPNGGMGNAPAGVGDAKGSSPQTGSCGSAGGFGVDADGSTTSCDFARAVANAVAANSAGTTHFSVNATSPATGQNYEMSCMQTKGTFLCRGGNGAMVTLKGGKVAETASASEKVVLNGTVTMKHPAELLNGQPSPNGEDPQSEYLVLQLDAPQNIPGIKSGTNKEVQTHNKSAIALGKKETIRSSSTFSTDTTGPWRQYEGKRIQITTTAESLAYQSDASMPLGLPRLANEGYSVELLG